MNAMYIALAPAEAADQILAIYSEHAVRARSLSTRKPILWMPVLCKAWEQCHLPICDLTGGLKCAVEKGWLMKTPIANPGYLLSPDTITPSAATFIGVA
jgi:hypothetical protein